MSEREAEEEVVAVREGSPPPSAMPLFRPPPFFEKTWVLVASLSLGCVAPLAFLVYNLKVPLDVFFFLLGCLVSLLLLRGALVVFDPGSVPPWPHHVGYLLKLLAVANALCALRLGAALLSYDEELLGLAPFLWLQVVEVAFLWCLAVLAYLVGDAQIRRARR